MTAIPLTASSATADFGGYPAPYRTINPIHAFFLRLLGPADCWDSPLVGTKYDPCYRVARQRAQAQRWRERTERRRASRSA